MDLQAIFIRIYAIKYADFNIILYEPLRDSACGARPAALWGKFRLRLALTGKPKPLLV